VHVSSALCALNIKLKSDSLVLAKHEKKTTAFESFNNENESFFFKNRFFLVFSERLERKKKYPDERISLL
jgi:hypothetical protein